MVSVGSQGKVGFFLFTEREEVADSVRKVIPELVMVGDVEDVKEASIVLLDHESPLYEPVILKRLMEKGCKVVLLVEDFLMEEEAAEDPLVDEVLSMDSLGWEWLSDLRSNPLLLWVEELAESKEVPPKISKLYSELAEYLEPNIRIYKSYKALMEKESQQEVVEEKDWVSEAKEGIKVLLERLRDLFSYQFVPAYLTRGSEKAMEEESFYVELLNGNIEEVSIKLEGQRIKIESSYKGDKLVTKKGLSIPIGYLDKEEAKKLIKQMES